MLFTTTTQFAALAICLVAGWFFGLASRSGGAKWKARYAAEREAHGSYRKQGDTGLAEANARVASANARIAELERENARLARAAETVPVAAATPSLAERVTGRTAVSRVRPAYPAGGTRPGWFDFGGRPRI